MAGTERFTLAESIIGLYKTELIRRRSSWRSFDKVELATLEYVWWFNNHCLIETMGHIRPAEYEAAYYLRLAGSLGAGDTRHKRSPTKPARFIQRFPAWRHCLPAGPPAKPRKAAKVVLQGAMLQWSEAYRAEPETAS